MNGAGTCRDADGQAFECAFEAGERVE
jgi:hypothetical protein